jgi:hypothetical protein
MALNTTNFNTTDLKPLYEWFLENGEPYFDKIELSEDELTLSCYVGDIVALKIAYASSDVRQLSVTFGTDNGWTGTYKPYIYNDGSSSEYEYVNSATKTDYGLAFQIYTMRDTSGVLKYRTGLFITKDNADKTAFVWHASFLTYKDTSSNPTRSEYIYSRSMDAALTCNVSFDYLKNDFGFKNTHGYMQFVPVPIYGLGLRYTPNCFVTPYADSTLGTECILEKDGEKYLYNGYVALKV